VSMAKNSGGWSVGSLDMGGVQGSGSGAGAKV
jgi:hypothetical protein